MNWTAPRIWDGGRCIIIGGGSSMPSQFDIPPEVVAKVKDRNDPTGLNAYSPYMDSIHAEHVIAVNNDFLLGPWVDACFFGDCVWYNVWRSTLAEWLNLKVTCCPRFAGRSQDKMEGLKYLRKDPDKKLGLSENPQRLSWNFNSGSSAIGLAYHFGARQIILLGFDMWHEGQDTHHHQGHGHAKISYARFLRCFPFIAADAQRLGIEILNCSPGTAIPDFPVASLREVL